MTFEIQANQRQTEICLRGAAFWSKIRLDRDDAIWHVRTLLSSPIRYRQDLSPETPDPGGLSCQPDMASPLRSTVRRLTTTARRAAIAEATNTYGRHGESINAYGIAVSKAQGVVDGLTGGKSLRRSSHTPWAFTFIMSQELDILED